MSTDGIGWVSAPAAVGGNSAYGGGRFVATGEPQIGAGDYAMAWSEDGLAWTPADTGFSGGGTFAISEIAWGEGVFVVVATSGYTGYSLDGGETWTLNPPLSGQSWLRGVAYGDGRFVAVGWDGTVLTSDDGIAWMPVPGVAPVSTHFFGVAFNDDVGEFMIGGRDGPDWEAVTLVSTDGGEMWQDVGFPVLGDRYCDLLAAAEPGA